MNYDDLVNGPTAVASDVEAGLKPSEPGDVLSVGDRAGDYEIVRRIGGGAMGDVYEGVQEEIGKRVAIKVIKNVLADSDEAAERFKREARAVNRIDHPNVLDVFAFGQLDSGRLWLAMDLLEGESLGSRLRSGGAMEIDEFVDVISQVCAALTAAHDTGIVHRDLKPDNVFLAETSDDSARVYVLDFGIAKILSDAAVETGKGTLTGEGVWIGTPAYMAPEQWTAEGASPRSDIYALGAMAYEMLTGSVPYKAQSVPGIMEKHFHADVPHLDTGAGRQLPEGMDRAVRRAMAKKPQDRFESAGEFLDELQAAVAGVSRPATRAVPAGAAPTAKGGLERKRPLPIWAATVGVLVLAAAIALAMVMRWRDDVAADDNAAKPTDETSLEAETETAPPGKLTILFESDPREAAVTIDGTEIGKTPVQHVFESGQQFTVALGKPGYAVATETMTADKDQTRSFSLVAVKGFEGIWQLEDGRFREFRRDKRQVLAWSLTSASGDGRTELGTFEFTPSEHPGQVVFSRATEQADERNPNHPSCRRRLGAQYRFDLEARTLELRLEVDDVKFAHGICTVTDKWWGPYKPLRRAPTATTEHTVRTESTAGSGKVVVKNNSSARRRRQLALEEKQLKSRNAKDVSPRAADSNNVPQQQRTVTPAPLDNVAQGGIEPAQRQMTRSPVKANTNNKAPATKNAPRTRKPRSNKQQQALPQLQRKSKK